MLFSIYYILVAFISNIFIGTLTFLLFQKFFQAKWSENNEKNCKINLQKIELLLLIILSMPILTDLF
jgi:membrane protein YqaA with SNARE-associated domain